MSGIFSQEDLDEFIQFARYGDIDAIQYYIDHNMDVNYANSEGNTALHMACANGFVDIVELLLNNGAKSCKNLNGNNPLHWASQNGHREVVEVLVKRRVVSVLEKNNFGKDAISEALRKAPEITTDVSGLLLNAVDETEATAQLAAHGGGDSNSNDEETGEFNEIDVEDCNQEDKLMD